MIRSDLILHFLIGFIIAVVFSKILPGLYPVLISLFFGLCKELYDKYIKHSNFDIKDLLLTVAGGFFACWLNSITYRWWL